MSQTSVSPGSSLAQWRLRPGADRRFRAGHPWVYSNELTASPKGIEPGAPIELRDAGGNFLARGYGNPASLICFRELTRTESDKNPWSSDFLVEKLRSAARIRESAGLGPFSYRLCFGEVDGLPGLVIDRYRLTTGHLVWVTQAHTAGIDRLLPQIGEALEKLSGQDWAKSAWVIRNDLGVRKLEGIADEAPRVARLPSGLTEKGLTEAKIRIAPALTEVNDLGSTAIEFSVDLIQGQKTGFFLDQAGNIRQTLQQLIPFARERAKQGSRRLKLIDLCCYVGQWSAQIAWALKTYAGVECEITLVDASQSALDRAKANVAPHAARLETLKADVLHELGSVETGAFDVVISDPPALIKSRKDIPQGKHAYLQLHTQALRMVSNTGMIVACSCSALLEEEDFLASLAKASARHFNIRNRRVRWTARGTQATDHPALSEFPEGRYLKCWIGFV